MKVKIKVAWSMSIVAMLILLVFQAIVLLDSYRSKKDMIEREISFFIRESVEEEVNYRNEKKSESQGKHILIDNKTYEEDPVYQEHESFVLNEQELIEAGFLQQILHYTGRPFNLQMLDSIFGSELQNAKISDSYALYYRDSTGAIIEQSGVLSLAESDKAFKTDSLLIIDGTRVQAYVVISPPKVFIRMLRLLILSFLVVILLSVCFVYQIKTIFTQNKLNEFKNDFIHAYIHNMKSPLGVIKIVLSKFISGELDHRPDKKASFGSKGMAQVERLLLQMEQILLLAKLESGTLSLNRSKTDVAAMINELKEEYSGSKDKQVTILTSVKIDNDEAIFIDRLLIKEAVYNLIGNAIKYSGDSVKINIDCYIEGNSLHIRVKDNGFGIAQKYQSKIFEKFERGAAAEKKDVKGFGLGLTFVKRATEAHGGMVKLFSQEGEYSEFTLLLPLRPEPVENESQETLLT